MAAVDLHVHSNRSDGSLSPAQLVDYACEKGLEAFALTDHDTIDGLEEAISHARSLRQKAAGSLAADSVPEVIPGIEFSTEYKKQDVHIVGLYIDYRNAGLRQQLQDFVDSRNARNRKMCGLLQEAGISVTYEALLSEFPGAVITRAHYAKYMQSHGYVKSLAEAFERYVGDDCPCYVPREKVTPEDAVKLILSVGGIPILAHPVLYHISDEELEALTSRLAGIGLVGLEAVYSTYTASDERRMRSLAKRYGLLVSGGSDFHGANKPGLDMGTGYGSLYVPYSVLRDLKRIRQR